MNLSRQDGTLNPDRLNTPITIIGAGGIGSWTTLSLAKLGFSSLQCIDFDTVDDVNIPSQVFAPAQVGKPKTEALFDVVKLLTGTAIRDVNARYDAAQINGAKVVIVAVDNMALRKQIAEDFRDGKLLATHVVDARMAIETGIVTTYNADSVAAYLERLYTDEQAEAEACTNKAIAYTTLIIAGLISKTVTALLDGHTMKVNFSLQIKHGMTPEMQIFTKCAAPVVSGMEYSEDEDSDEDSDEGNAEETNEDYPF